MPFKELNVQEVIRETKNNDDAFKVGWESWENEKEIISQLIEIRKQLNLKQIDLAKLSGNTQQEISRMERRGHSPSLRTVCRVINCMGYELVIRERQENK